MDVEKLININLQIEHYEEELNSFKGFKLLIFQALYLIEQFKLNNFLDIIFTIIEFIQLIGFPMDKIFEDSWGNYWIDIIGNFFRFSQLSYLWKGTNFFMATYIFTFIYIIIFLFLFIIILIKPSSFISGKIAKIIALMLQFQIILNIPILKILFYIFSCEKDYLEVSSEIKCKSSIHIFLMFISIIILIIYQLLIFLLHTTLYEFGINEDKFKSGYTSSSEVLLDLTQLILVIFYQFITNQILLALISLILSIIILIYFLIIQPYSNIFTMKLYTSLYALNFWSCIICIFSIILKNSKFRSGILLLILGYPLILIIIFFNFNEFSIENFFSLFISKTRGGYNSLLEIKNFMRLENSLDEKLKIKEYKILFSYISIYESKCSKQNCYLKQFMKIPFKPENIVSLKILLLNHAEILYKESISKYPKNIKLRLAYCLFLFNKLNKKVKAKNELFLLYTFETNLECSFLIYKIQKYINDNVKINENISESLSNRDIIKRIQLLIENIVSDYISFWNILLTQDYNKNENVLKMSLLGEDIKCLNEKLNNDIKYLDKWNLFEQKTLKIYIQYLKEIVNNKEDINIYKNKISEEEKDNHNFDEINIYKLNYEEMSKNENYKYIIINPLNNKIINISFNACKIFGYTKEELIDQFLFILFPEIYKNSLKFFFQNKIEEFKKNLLINDKKLKIETWIDNCFGINKGNYLISIKIKWFLIYLEDDNIYGVGNIFQEKELIINNIEQEKVFVLTDKNYNIQNFTINAIKILGLDYNSIINDSNICNYVLELKDNLKSEIKDEKEESDISMKRYNRKTKYIKSEILQNNVEINSVKIIHWKNYEFKNNLKNKSKKINSNDDIISLPKKNIPRRKSLENIYLFRNNIDNKKINSSLTIKKINFSQTYNLEMDIFKDSKNSNYIKSKGLLFNMEIKEAKYNNYKVGYIFIFKTYTNKKEENNINEIKELISPSDIISNNITEESIISFEENKKNVINNLFEKEDQFTFDINSMSYKQVKYNIKKNNFYEDLRERAIKKLIRIKKEFQNEESENEEESSEYEYTSDEDNSNDSSELVSKKKEEENKKLSKEIKNNNDNGDNKNKEISNVIINSNSNLKKYEEDFYHVNFNKITYYVFNYNQGYVEMQKNQKCKISQVTYLLNSEKEKIKNSNSIVTANTKFMKFKKKISFYKKEENEINIFNNTHIKLKQINNTLSSKNKENSLFKLLLSSIIIFILVTGIGIMNILIYYYLKNKIYSFFILIEKSDNLYQNLLFEISLVKEMLIVNSPYYNNTLNKNKTLYYNSLAKMIYHYYTDNFFIISNLTNRFNILSKKDEESITQKLVELYIIDNTKSSKLNYYQYKKYNILVYSAYRELNSALYHISQLNMEEIYQYNDNVFYFLKNGMSNLLISSETQMWKITTEFQEKIKSGHLIIIICCLGLFFAYILFMFIFSYFYKNVSIKKEKYLLIFQKLDINLIISALQRCENFISKLREEKQNKNFIENKISFYSSTINNSENDISYSPVLMGKNNKKEIITQPKGVNKPNNHKNSYIFQIILFLFLFLWQLIIYIYYYQRISLYEKIATYEYYITMYSANFFFIFIVIREYPFNKKFIFYNKTVDEYIDNDLSNYYIIFSQTSKMKDIYRVYFPNSYQVFLNYLYSSKICEFINNYISEYPKESNTSCETFFFGCPRFNFFDILAMFIDFLLL